MKLEIQKVIANHKSKSNSLKKIKRKQKNSLSLEYLENCLNSERRTPSGYERTSDERYGRIEMLEELIEKVKSN